MEQIFILVAFLIAATLGPGTILVLIAALWIWTLVDPIRVVRPHPPRGPAARRLGHALLGTAFSVTLALMLFGKTSP
ncbi:MAG: hypothetical protein AAFM92_11230 [Pseudomonadota bacterium]